MSGIARSLQFYIPLRLCETHESHAHRSRTLTDWWSTNRFCGWLDKGYPGNDMDDLDRHLWSAVEEPPHCVPGLSLCHDDRFPKIPRVLIPGPYHAGFLDSGTLRNDVCLCVRSSNWNIASPPVHESVRREHILASPHKSLFCSLSILCKFL